jgi:hypothetical protein
MANEVGEPLGVPPENWEDVEEYEKSDHPRLRELGAIYRAIIPALLAAGAISGAAWVATL